MEIVRPLISVFAIMAIHLQTVPQQGLAMGLHLQMLLSVQVMEVVTIMTTVLVLLDTVECYAILLFVTVSIAIRNLFVRVMAFVLHQTVASAVQSSWVKHVIFQFVSLLVEMRHMSAVDMESVYLLKTAIALPATQEKTVK